MAIAYCILASGSSGNCVWVRGGGVEVLVDCGLSAREIARRLAEVGGDLKEIQAVICTHAHTDHVAGAAVLARRHDLDIHATSATLERISGHPPSERLRPLPVEGTIRIGGLAVHTLPTMHDAPDSVALVLSDGDTHLGVATDLGRPTQRLARALATVDGLILEANHDLEMLLAGPYPEMLKRRIRSRVGHLSNDQSAELLDRVLHPGLQHLTLAHLSEQNNTPARAESTVESVLERSGVCPTLAVANQHMPGAPIALEPNLQQPPYHWEPGSLMRSEAAEPRSECTRKGARKPPTAAQLRLSYWKP